MRTIFIINVLVTSPPKSILDKESRLIEIGCVPGAVLYFGSNQELNGNQFLRKDLQNKFTTNSIASLAASRMRYFIFYKNILFIFYIAK